MNETEIILSSAAARVVGINLLGDAISYLDFEMENNEKKILNRVPSKLLNVDAEAPVVASTFKLDTPAKGEKIVARVIARTGHTVNYATHIVLILKK